MPFERRDISDSAAERQVRRALSARDGRGTLADVVVATGLPEKVVERALDRVIDEYDGAISVAKGGVLHYRFVMGPFGLKRRMERRPLWRVAVRTSAAMMSAAVKAFEIAFRTVLAVQLLVYTIAILTPLSLVAGIVVGIVCLVVVLFSGEDVSGLIEVMTDPYGAAFVMLCSWAYGTYLVFKKKIAVLMALVGRDERGKKGIAGFVAQINDFALGPDKPPTQNERVDRAWRVSQQDELCILHRIREHNGRLRAGHLVEWLGMSFDEAERQAARIAVEYGGVPTADAVDVLEFSFESLQPTEGGDVAQDLRTRHERGVTLPRLTANTLSENAVIAGFGLFNLGVAAVAGHLMREQMVIDATHAFWWRIGAFAGGTLPFAFSVLLFFVFAVRIPMHALRTHLLQRRQRRAAVHDEIIAQVRKRHDKPFDLDKIHTSRDEARAVALALEGSFELDSEENTTKTLWRFPRLWHELSA